MQILKIAVLLLMNLTLCQAGGIPKENNTKVAVSHVKSKVNHPVQTKVLSLHDYIKKRCGNKCVGESTQWLEVAVKKASKEQGVPEKLIYSVIAIESNFNKAAKSGSQVGLMQIVLGLHKAKFKGKAVYNVENNVSVGTQILKECLDKHDGAIVKTFHCYNGGGDAKYEQKVLKALTDLRRLRDFKSS